jgi:DNA-binding beta-propeller fold protein YncE
MVSTLAGSGAAGSSDGIGALASFTNPHGMAISRSGAFAVAAERIGNRIRIIDLVTAQVLTLAGSGSNVHADGNGTRASFSFPQDIAISPDDSFVLVVDGSVVRHILIATGVVTTLAGNESGYADGVGTLAKFSSPRGIAISPDGTFALIADRFNYRIRRLDMLTKNVTTVAGSTQNFTDGVGTNANFKGMLHVDIDPTGSYALICDNNDSRIRRLDIASSQVTTLAGSGKGVSQDGVGTNAIFQTPIGVSIDPTGTYALVTDFAPTGGNRIRRIAIASALVTTLAGSDSASAIDGVGAQSTFNYSSGISIAFDGTFALVADYNSNRIRRIALSSPPCSAGFYCPAGSSSPTQVACTPGYFCNVTGLSTTSGPCNAGRFCPPGSLTANGAGPCAAGFSCSIASVNPYGGLWNCTFFVDYQRVCVDPF